MSVASLNNEPDTNNETGSNKMWVVVSETPRWRGGEKPGRTEVDVDKLSSNMILFLGKIGNMLEQAPEHVGQFRFQEFEISAEVTAEGKLAILGTGLLAGAKGGLKFVFRRSTPS